MDDTQQQIKDLIARLDGLQKQNDMLMKVAPQAQLSRLMEQNRQIGKSFRVWLYRDNPEDKYVLVTGYRMLSNDAYVDREANKTFENQRIRLSLDKEIAVQGKLNQKKAYLANTKDPVKRDALIKELMDMENSINAGGKDAFVDMAYIDFMVNYIGNRITKKEVDVKGTKEIDGKTYYIFDWEGKEKEIDINYIN